MPEEITNEVNCPMMKKIIDLGYCIELQMVADKDIKPTDDEKHLTDKDFVICKNCKKRIDPAL